MTKNKGKEIKKKRIGDFFFGGGEKIDTEIGSKTSVLQFLKKIIRLSLRQFNTLFFFFFFSFPKSNHGFSQEFDFCVRTNLVRYKSPIPSPPSPVHERKSGWLNDGLAG